MKTKLDEIRGRIQQSTVTTTDPESIYDTRELLGILLDLTEELQRIESLARRTADTASCLANGIKPD